MPQTLPNTSLDTIATLTARVTALEKQAATRGGEDAVTLFVMSDQLDKLMPALTLASASAACGSKVVMFFALWAVAALKRPAPPARKKSVVERLFGAMLPGGMQRRSLSKLDMFGLGRWMMKAEMRKKKFPTLAELLATAGESGVEIHVCQPTLDLMGIHLDELVDYPGLKVAGAASFLETAARGRVNFFIS